MQMNGKSLNNFGGKNPQRATVPGKRLNNMGGKNPQATTRAGGVMGKSPQLTITPRLLNSIKASPKGIVPSALRGYASGSGATKKLRVK